MGTFHRQLQAFETKTNKEMTAALKRIVLELFKRIMERTPVDTGTARVNWEIGVGSIPRSVAIILEEGAEPEGFVSQEAWVNGLRELAAIRPGDVAYIVNNIEYIEILEEGSKGRSGAGMVKLTVREFASIVDEIAGNPL